MAYGYMGKILMVDLSRGTITEETIPDEVYQRYLSGLGLGAYILYNRIPADADPLGPDNILGFMSGLLTGTGSLFTGRWIVVGKSPLTGGWGDANCGGTFSPVIKRCGYDGIFFSGISQNPVYLCISGGKAELKDAFDLWGKDAVETEEILLEKSGSKTARVACIGPSGEKLSLISGICNDRGRIAARSGLGAVMGSKKLKAIVLDGKERIPVHNKEEMKTLSQECNKFVKKTFPFVSGSGLPYVGAFMRVLPTQMAQDGLLFKVLLQKWGTIFQNQFAVESGDAPVMNWKGNGAEFGNKKSKSVNPDLFVDRELKKYHCYSCPVGCGGICTMNGKFSETHKPEYETVISFGALLMNEDLESIFYVNELLNRAGMDTISAGGAVAFAMECFEQGILSKDDTGGLDLGWGNSTAIIELIEKMIAREGIGDILADGSKEAARRIGKDSEQYAMHAGGQQLPMHDPRNDPGYALHYSAEPTPGRHTIGSQLSYEMYQLWKKVKSLPKVKMLYHKNSKFVPGEEKAIWAQACSNYMNVVNGAGMCWFGAMFGCTRVPAFDWLDAATGWEKTPEEYMQIGERVQSIKQAFNVKHGIEPIDFKIKDRVAGYPPLAAGANKGRTVDVEKMMSDYWRLYGWDPQTGKPTTETLSRLEIEG